MALRHDVAVTQSTLAYHLGSFGQELDDPLRACDRAVCSGRRVFVLHLDAPFPSCAFRCAVQRFADGSHGVTQMERVR